MKPLLFLALVCVAACHEDKPKQPLIAPPLDSNGNVIKVNPNDPQYGPPGLPRSSVTPTPKRKQSP